MKFSIDTEITDHFKMFIGDVKDKALNEVGSGNSFDDELVVLVAIVMKGNVDAVIAVYPGGGDNGSA